MNAWHDRSESIAALAPDLVAALGKLSDVPKGRTADTGKYRYNYADLGDLLGMARPILSAHGIGILQPVTSETDSSDVLIWTTFVHRSGEFVTLAPLRMPTGQTPQATGSAITYGRRYALLAALGLAAEDDDGQQASQQRRPAPAPAAAPKPRTDAEAEARRLLAQLSRPQREQVQAMFLDDFGQALRDMPESDHGAALDWVRETLSALGDLGESLSE